MPNADALSPFIADPFYVVDSDDRIVTFNAAFRDMFDWSKASGSRCRDVAFLPCHSGQCLLERCAVEGTIRCHEQALNCTAAPVTLPNGQPGVMIILRDVGDVVRLQAAYQRAVQNHRERLERLLKLLGELERRRRETLTQMVLATAREMNLPGGVAIAAAEQMRDRLDADIWGGLAEIPGMGEDILDLKLGGELIQRNLLRVDELKRRLERNSTRLLLDVHEELDLRLATLEALHLWSREAKRGNLQVEIVDNLIPGLLWKGYAGLLGQMLTALFANVKMHAYPDGKGGKIEIILTSKEGVRPEFSVSVRDFGKGIAADVMPTIFDPGFTTVRNKGAEGLGLAIARQIATQHFGGTLTCESQPGAGATFTATFSHCLTPPSARRSASTG